MKNKIFQFGLIRNNDKHFFKIIFIDIKFIKCDHYYALDFIIFNCHLEIYKERLKYTIRYDPAKKLVNSDDIAKSTNNKC